MTKPIDKVYVKPGSKVYHRKSWSDRPWTSCGMVTVHGCVEMTETGAIASDFRPCGRCWAGGHARLRPGLIRKYLMNRGVLS